MNNKELKVASATKVKTNATIIMRDGSEKRVFIGNDDLEGLRKAIDHECRWVTYFTINGKRYYCDEEGLLKHLPINQKVTKLLLEAGIYDEECVGNAVVFDDGE
jgi:hypothetical protein